MIIAVIYKTKTAVKLKSEKMQSWTGFELMTSTQLVQCSTNWAVKPTGYITNSRDQLPVGMIAQLEEGSDPVQAYIFFSFNFSAA